MSAADGERLVSLPTVTSVLIGWQADVQTQSCFKMLTRTELRRRDLLLFFQGLYHSISLIQYV